MSGDPAVSLLLWGPPGTGKTAFAHHLARVADRPLLVKRASDLVSKWVGETEARIAGAFAEARRREAVLLFDEADSLLFDRANARNSWEVGQVNELLTWLDSHPLPVVAATNDPGRLDPATLRRFVFKIPLRPLGRERAARAFERFFGLEAPPALADTANLTPGDFALVARQLRYAPTGDAAELVERLRCEAASKPGCPRSDRLLTRRRGISRRSGLRRPVRVAQRDGGEDQTRPRHRRPPRRIAPTSACPGPSCRRSRGLEPSRPRLRRRP